VDTTPANRRLIPELIRVFQEIEPDAVILCGDLSPYPKDMRAVLQEFGLKLPNCRKLFVSGNHDIWLDEEGPGASSAKKQALISEMCAETGFHHLDREALLVDHVGFCGTIGWYDYSFRDETYGLPIEEYRKKRCGKEVWMDLHLAHWGRPDEEVARACEESLKNQIESVRAKCEKIIVATHHVPFRECVRYEGRLPWDYFSSFMGSAGLGKICLQEAKVSHVLFGHTHFQMKVEVGSITALCSPIGYLFDPPAELRAYAKSRVAVFRA
jgi:predicted phosphohydrolase